MMAGRTSGAGTIERVYELQLIGGGKMGSALLGGIIGSGLVSPEQVVVVESSEERRSELSSAFPGVTVEASIVPAHNVIVATKPGGVVGVVAAAATAGATRVLSIAAGVSIAQMTEAVPRDRADSCAVLRCMPNTPALVGHGAAAIAGGPTATDADITWAVDLLSAVGTVTVVPESAMDAVTGVSGSGPAYVFLIAEALIDGGVAAGLPRDVAVQLAHQTILGAGALLAEPGADAPTLRAAVTSPGGTTAAGLRSLEDRGVRAAIMEAVASATARSKELGQES